MLPRIGSKPETQVNVQEMGFAVAEDELYASLVHEVQVSAEHPKQQVGASEVRMDHEPFAHDQGLLGQSLQKMRKVVLFDMPLGEGCIAAPSKAHATGEPAIPARIEVAALGVIGFDQKTFVVVGNGAVALHFLHIDLITETVDGLLFLGCLGRKDSVFAHRPVPLCVRTHQSLNELQSQIEYRGKMPRFRASSRHWQRGPVR